MTKARLGICGLVAAAVMTRSSAEEPPLLRELEEAREAYDIAASEAKDNLLARYDAAITRLRDAGDDKGAERVARLKNEFLKSIDPDHVPERRQYLAPTEAELDEFVGRYPLADGRVLVVTREGDRLFVEAPGMENGELKMVAGDKFQCSGRPQCLTFYRDANGAVDEVVLHGVPQAAKRIDESEVETIRIAAQIDGRSRLMLRGDSVWWHHLDFACPGRHDGKNMPTVINGKEWFPVWPDFRGLDNRFACLPSSVYRGLSPSLPFTEAEFSAGIVRGRGSFRIIDVPRADNDFTLTCELFDEDGAEDYYVVELYRRKATPTPAGVPAPAAIATEGLVLHLPLDGDAKDVSGFGRDGKVNGASPTADRFGRDAKALVFSGWGSVRAPAPPREDNSPFSASAWCSYSGEGFDWWSNVIICRDSPTGRLWQLSTRQDRVTWHWVGKGPDIGAAQRIARDVWYHVAVTFDGEVLRLYLDGQLIDWHAGRIGANDRVPIDIGRRSWDDYPLFFHGAIDDVRMYDRALTRRQVLALYREKGFGSSPLVRASERGDVDEVKRLLAGGADVDEPDKNGRSPLLCAAEREHAKVVKVLLAAGANLNSVGPEDESPLHAAARGVHAGTVKLLIAAAADVGAKTSRERTPLHFAAAAGDVESVRSLLANGADANAADARGNAPLHRAAAYGRTQVVKLLLANDANARAVNSKQEAPLDLAHKLKMEEVAGLLKKHLEEKGRADDEAF